MLKYAKRFTREQKSVILSEHLEGGVSISELSRKYQVSPHTIYIWRRAMKKEDVVSLEPAELLSEIEKLKRENSLLKHRVADQALDIETLKGWNDFIKKKLREGRLSLQKSSLGEEGVSGSRKKGSVS